MIRQKNQKSKIALANDVNIVEVGQKFVKLVKNNLTCLSDLIEENSWFILEKAKQDLY